jgi:peptidyl-prolyl cis-trans isomerase C
MTKLARISASACLIALMGTIVSAQEPKKKETPPPSKDAPPTTLLTAPSETPPPVRPKGSAAKVNGQDLTMVALERSLLGVPKDKRGEAKAEILNFLIDGMLVDQALVHWKIEADVKDVEKQVTEFKKMVVDAKQDYAKVLTNLMLTEEELKEHIVGELRWQKFVSQQAPDDKLKTFFDQNMDMFDGTMVRGRHILLAPKNDPKAKEEAVKELQTMKAKIEADAQKAVTEEVAKMGNKPDPLTLEQLKNKKLEETFSSVARQKSHCPSNREGGDLNWFPRVGSMVEPFAKAAFALNPYQMSDVVTTEFGYHLILATAKKKGEAVKFELLKDVVKDVYGSKLREKVIDMMRKQAKIEILPTAKEEESVPQPKKQ